MTTDRTAAAGVVVLHAWWGRNDDVRSYADRLAAEGLAVATPDLYDGRLAATIEDAERLAGAIDQDRADGIVLAAVDELVDRLGPDARIGVVGFSLGAMWSIWLPTKRPAVVASVVYYGTNGGPVLTEAATPVLGHFAEDDPYEPDEWVAEVEATLRGVGRDVTFHRYAGTGHWFAEPSREAYVPGAAQLAFDRTVAFLRRELAPAP
jgi:carboxymethylenebutenolidase